MYYAIYWISVAFTDRDLRSRWPTSSWKYKREPGRKAKFRPGTISSHSRSSGPSRHVLLLLWLFHRGLRRLREDERSRRRTRSRFAFAACSGTGSSSMKAASSTTYNKMKVPVNTAGEAHHELATTCSTRFFVPGFRVKRDVVPGMYTSLWFEATHDHALHAGPTAVRERQRLRRERDGYHCGRDLREISDCGARRRGAVLMGVAAARGCRGHADGSLLHDSPCSAPSTAARPRASPRRSATPTAGYNTNHSTMIADLRVLPVEGYDRFLEVGPPPPNPSLRQDAEL